MIQISIASDNDLLPIRRQAIIQLIAVLLSIGPLGTNFSEISFYIKNFSFTKMHLKYRRRSGGQFVQGEMSKGSNWQLFSIGLAYQRERVMPLNAIITTFYETIRRH